METTIQQQSDGMNSAVEAHGSPEARAAGHLEAEGRSQMATRETTRQLSILQKVFGVYLDPRTWEALLFTLMSLVTGVLYFSWAVTGLALSVAFSILIIGAPFAVLFLLSVRGLTVLEAHLTEALLGVKMQTRPVLPEGSRNWLARLKALVTSRHTWRSMLYLVLQLPLGVMYFTLTVVLLAWSLGVMALPFAFWFGEPQFIIIGNLQVVMRSWFPVVMETAGFLMLTASLHVIRAVARWHGGYARKLLAS